MSVQTQQFRVVGVNTQTGEDISVVIDAGTKAAAEVKADQMHIETTHIVRIKQDTPEPRDEHELFSSEAAQALAGKRTDKLIEEIVPPEEPKTAPQAQDDSPTEQPTNSPTNYAPTPCTPQATPPPAVTPIARLSYAGPASREARTDQVSGLRAFGLVLLVLLGIAAGSYFVLVHQPNTIQAHNDELIFGQDLFSDVLETPTLESPFDKLQRDAFNDQGKASLTPSSPPIAPDQQIKVTPPQENQEPSTKAGSESETRQTTAPPNATKNTKLKLQSVVTTHKGRFAVINGKLYEQGDAFGSATLVSVADDWVLIERDGKQFTLLIETSTSK